MGKTPVRAKAWTQSWKHPHARGEDSAAQRTGDRCQETPPHAWGRHLARRYRAAIGGNTPTRVGKTRWSWWQPHQRRKHPHTRGEDRARRSRSPLLPETPPHAWGRQVGARQVGARQGNTPTRVGKTTGRTTPGACNRKHPHTRGEDPVTRRINWRIRETPPHAWGRHGVDRLAILSEGNTPTRVGKTSQGMESANAWWKHPHTRGED